MTLVTLGSLSELGPGLGNDRNQRITKKCSAFCPTIDLNIGIAGVATSCCETSLCNISGASSVKTSYTMIALGVLASLACILQPNKPKYVISKMCSPTCPSRSQQQNQTYQSVYCCEKPLCNVNGVSSKHSSYGVMSLGVLTAITYIFACGL
ncbi:lymphocyte antigen 6e-like [Limosa lapponica baueri]|uniref:Lymphocyte antigen 6e-like n=1 Tax=Limosa lapponica baueri TaxID=1758121 RepID=A0A2I0TLL8_LIMLA|nr:lymphocyte antigen 6e-like [Limosa lapponica baueri]